MEALKLARSSSIFSFCRSAYSDAEPPWSAQCGSSSGGPCRWWSSCRYIAKPLNTTLTEARDVSSACNREDKQLVHVLFHSSAYWLVSSNSPHFDFHHQFRSEWIHRYNTEDIHTHTVCVLNNSVYTVWVLSVWTDSDHSDCTKNSRNMPGN